jgi:hypothetical protein
VRENPNKSLSYNCKEEEAVTVLPNDPEVILDVAGEGGGYTILGERHQGAWRFWRKAGGSDEWLYDEDETITSSSPITPAREPVICYSHTIEKALEQINSSWPYLHPLQVHSAFAQEIWNLVVRFWRDNGNHRTRRIISKWSALCIGQEISSVDEISTCVCSKGVD